MLKKLLLVVVSLGLIGGGGYYGYKNEKVKKLVASRFDPGVFFTFEIKYSADQIMEAKKAELLSEKNQVFQRPELQFYPYLLMEVKYCKSEQTTAEGLLLWSLVDGELVTTTASWDQTHGFQDCIEANVNKFDFKIINALASHGGSMSRKDLCHHIHVDDDILDRWIDSCTRKKLVVKNGNCFRLHLQSPKLKIEPQTNLDQWLVTQSAKTQVFKKPKKYSQRQIEKIAHLAFGVDFTIRGVKEIFLPVYKIEVKKPDGSIYTSHWNAVTGKRLDKLTNIAK